MALDAEKIAQLSNDELKALESNVARLGQTGTPAQLTEAARLAPLIEHERATRKPVKAPAAPKRAATKRKAAATS